MNKHQKNTPGKLQARNAGLFTYCGFISIVCIALLGGCAGKPDHVSDSSDSASGGRCPFGFDQISSDTDDSAQTAYHHTELAPPVAQSSTDAPSTATHPAPGTSSVPAASQMPTVKPASGPQTASEVDFAVNAYWIETGELPADTASLQSVLNEKGYTFAIEDVEFTSAESNDGMLEVTTIVAGEPAVGAPFTLNDTRTALAYAYTEYKLYHAILEGASKGEPLTQDEINELASKVYFATSE